MIERFVLFTNLDYVVVNDVRTYTHALLLEEVSGIDRKLRHRARGFGVVPTMPTFDVEIPSIEFKMERAASRDMFLSDANPEPRPLFSGAILTIDNGGPAFQLICGDNRNEICIDRFEGAVEDRPVLRVWGALPGRVASFWRAPAIPVVQFLPTILVRGQLNRG